MQKLIIVLLLLLHSSLAAANSSLFTLHSSLTELKPRLVVCTDIAPADVEPDDMESMVRLMAYADLFEVEALITSVGWNCDPYPVEWAEYLQRVIEAYRKDVPNLMKRSGQKSFLPMKEEEGRQYIGYWPSADYLKSRAEMGSINGGIKSIGENNDSPGSDLLIRLADEDDPRPIYVAAWGGANTLAQAIWRVKQTRSAEELKRFVSKFRIYTITDQDMQYSMRMDRAYSSHQWLRREFADDLQFIWDEGTWQEQCELGKQNWQKHKDYIQGKGALGREYPNYKWGVEGDTPSFLYVMPNGLNDPEDPRQAGWAGYHERGLCADSLTTAWTSWQEPQRSVSVGYKRRFYPDELNDFCARMQWAAEGRGNRNPQVIVTCRESDLSNSNSSPFTLHSSLSKAGETICLDASQSVDPDGDGLTFRWWQQPEPGAALVTIDGADKSVATIHIPDGFAGQSFHIICEVHDDGPFQLVAYRRIIVNTTTALLGSWSGKLDLGVASLTLVLNLEQADGYVKVTMDSPDQGAKGIPVFKEYLSDDSLAVKVEQLNMTYRASLKDGKLDGTFTQNGMSLPLVLTKGVSEVNRPQTPQPPFPYQTEEVTFRNEKDGATLAGTLTWPVGYDPKSKKKPLVALFVTGSGQENRDEEVFEHKPFLVIADYLARQGIATLRYDDRATGASKGGDIKNATSEDFARDAAAGLEYLRNRKAFDKIGIIGHSEGGLIAFMLGAQGKTDFVVSLAGPGVKGDTLLAAQNNRLLMLSGMPATMTVEKLRSQQEVQHSPWIKWFIDYDPSADIAATRCPVFALNGSYDCQVISSQNLPAIERMLPKSKKNLIKEYPGLNHLFQHCTTGLVNEYRQIEETLSPEVLSDIATWIKGLK